MKPSPGLRYKRAHVAILHDFCVKESPLVSLAFFLARERVSSIKGIGAFRV